MKPLTQKQGRILEFIQNRQQREGAPPSLREIARHFGFRSMNAAVAHVQALCRKGVLKSHPGQARSLQVVASGPGAHSQNGVLEVPIYGAIPAGFADHRQQEVKGCLSVDIERLGIRPTARTFALQVQGDSMIGKHILPGDYVILEHGRTPRPGDVVAALIDNESTLKTYVVEGGKPSLRAENPNYPKLIPAQELVIQGVMIALVRRTGE